MMNAIVLYSIYILIAILGSGLVVIVFGSGLAIVDKFGTRVLPWVFPLIGASVVLETVASNRNVDLYVLNPAFTYGAYSDLRLWILRACGWSVLALCGAYIVASLFSLHGKQRCASSLFISFLAYFICTSLLNGILGSVPALDYKAFYIPLVVTAFYIGQSISVETLIWYAKTTGIVSIIFGLVAAVFYPSIAVQTNFHSVIIPWPPIRLWGLDSHANTLGPMVVMVLLLELGNPYQSKSIHWGVLICGGITLFLTQSKTAWAMFIVASLAFGLFNLSSEVLGELRRFRFKTSSFLVFLGVACTIVGSSIYMLYGDADKVFGRFMATPEGADIASMTGRDVIWNITLTEWRNNILFGYGPDLWGQQFSSKYHLLGTASNAHNQFVDVIGSSGLFGISAFVVYFLFLMKYAFASRHIAGWLPVALLIALSIRSIAEVPFKLVDLSSNDFAFHLILLGIIFASMNRLKHTVSPVSQKEKGDLI